LVRWEGLKHTSEPAPWRRYACLCCGFAVPEALRLYRPALCSSGDSVELQEPVVVLRTDHGLPLILLLVGSCCYGNPVFVSRAA
jgi:hypothetical protein